ncbi:MAG: IS1182 family transposase, partial [Oscillospiraceae bacterium]|nr:IS1182 family transposase [Oscillospiraceae bacterium]
MASVPNNKHSGGQNETRSGQLIFPMGIEYYIPEDDIVRFFAREYENLDYTNLYAVTCGTPYHCGPGRPQTDPKLLFQICAFAYANDLYSSRKIEEACRKRIDFIWLLNGAPAPDHTTIANFRSGECKEAIEDLFYQHVCYLDKIGATDHKVGIFDGTKIESFANRYTFVWRGTVEKNLAKLVEKVKAIFSRLGIQEDATKDKLRSVIYKKQERMAALQINLAHGKGHRKSQLQRDHEELSGILEKWLEYEGHLRIMGPTRNSYSKTDPGATFFRMKDDHMRNSQLKPGYNLQICVNSEFITGLGVYADRNDVNTFESFMKTLIKKHGQQYEIALADAGYESLANYRFLDSIGIDSYIKPSNYEYMNTKKFKKQIGRRENMAYDEVGDYYICADQRHLCFVYEHTFTPHNGVKQTNKVYRCENCEGCICRQSCCKSKDVNKPKEIEVNLEFGAYREKSLANIISEYGIQLRTNRSIQAEGAFGVIKQDHHF